MRQARPVRGQNPRPRTLRDRDLGQVGHAERAEPTQEQRASRRGVSRRELGGSIQRGEAVKLK